MSLLDALLLDPAPFNVWIAKRTDGLKGSGTASDPYDGSTAARLDARMSEVPVNIWVHLGPGTFQTNGHAVGGSPGWQLKTGMKITGSGMEVTKIELTGHSAANYFYVAGHDISAGATASTEEQVRRLGEQLQRVEAELAKRDVAELSTMRLFTAVESLRRQIHRATGGDAPFTAPVSAIPPDEYHEDAQDWVA